MHHAGVCLLRQLPVAKFGRRKVSVTHLYTFDRCFRMVKWGLDSDRSLLSSMAEAMLRGYFECILRVIYRSTYIGIVFRSLIFETSIFLTSTSKSRVITTTLSHKDL